MQVDMCSQTNWNVIELIAEKPGKVELHPDGSVQHAALLGGQQKNENCTGYCTKRVAL